VRSFVAIGFAVWLAVAPCAQASELIVRFDGDATAADRLDARAGARTDLERRLPVQGMQLLEVEPGQSVAVAARELESDEHVLYAEPNAIRHALVRPNDPYFLDLWAMENTGQAIRGTTGVPDADSDVAEAWDAGIRGSTVVAVIDTGVDASHPDLAPNLVPGRDFIGADNDPADENGHGTHVSGTIAARRGNGLGVAGVADGAARVMPLRVLDGNGAGSVSNVILAYSHAFQNGAKVVNLSLGSASSSRAERDAIAAFPTMLFVAAAGNGGPDGVGDDNDAPAAGTTYPCAYALPNVLCVAASDNRDQLASFSNYGATSVDLAAPGASIASTWLAGGYSWASGTSMATPLVSGAAALLWSAAPSSQPTDISAALIAGTDAKPAFAGRTVSGGRLNVLRSLRLVADVGIGTPAPAPQPGGSGEPGTGTSGGQGSPGSPAGVGDAVAPRLSVRSRRRFAAARVLARGLPVSVRCSERCTARLTLRLRRRAVSVPVRASLRAGVSRRVVLRLSPVGRRLVRRRASLPLTLAARAVDPAGNRRTARIAVRVSR
jgi:subtilisin family serine protease